jgi:hypothetical protein
MTAGLEEHFARYGYIHLKGVLSPDEIAHLRSHLFARYDALEARAGHPVMSLGPHAALDTPEIHCLPFISRVVQALKVILEPSYTMFSDLVVAKNQVGLSAARKNPGWHWDSSGEGKQAYLYEPGYRIVKCGIYLQENTEDYGGGVDIVPGRHRWPLKSGNVNLNFKAKNLLDIIGMRFRGTMVRLEPGDFLAFDFCLPHRSTLPRKLLAGVTAEDLALNTIAATPRDKTKFVIYWSSCRGASANGYWASVKRRAMEEELANPDSKKLICTEAVSMKYPDDYAESLVGMAERAGVQFATFEKAEAADFRRQYEDRVVQTL